MAKTKTVLKTTNIQHSKSNGKQSDQESVGSVRGGSFRHFSILSHILR